MTSFDPAAGVFAEHRNLLFSVAYRILGSAADAEDAIQDAWLRWSAADRSQVADPKSYLGRIVANVAMDRLRSARARRETYVGPWLPEPIRTGAAALATDTDTAAVAETADSVSTALLVVLETLTPLERAVFVLREAFAFSYAEIADAVGRSEQTVRQTAHRAREHVRARRPGGRPDAARQREVTQLFLAAAAGGDINALMEVLAPDVTLWTDGGGKVRHAVRPVSGAARVARWFAGVATQPYEGVRPQDMSVDLTELNGAPGIVFTGAARVVSTLTFDFDEAGRITGIYNVANPDKLRDVATGAVHPMP